MKLLLSGERTHLSGKSKIMAEYISKQVKINRDDSVVYGSLCSFDNFTPMLKDKVEEWTATEDTCSFKAKGFTVKLMIIEKTPYSSIKIVGVDLPFETDFWIQIKKVDAYDTRLRLVVRAELNKMMKMMLGKKLQVGLDQMAEQLATGFNAR